MIVGVKHFTSTDFFIAIVTPIINWKEEAVLISGVVEIMFQLDPFQANVSQLIGLPLKSIPQDHEIVSIGVLGRESKPLTVKHVTIVS